MLGEEGDLLLGFEKGGNVFFLVLHAHLSAGQVNVENGQKSFSLRILLHQVSQVAPSEQVRLGFGEAEFEHLVVGVFEQVGKLS